MTLLIHAYACYYYENATFTNVHVWGDGMAGNAVRVGKLYELHVQSGEDPSLSRIPQLHPPALLAQVPA